MRPCTPTLIVRIFGTSTWEDLRLVAYSTVVRTLPVSACFCCSLVLFRKKALPLGAHQKPVLWAKETLMYSAKWSSF
jgi:hypothetical protein